ncbi:SatD family protein [Tenacibaculum aiptasiae]|uniref:SatD family protein n=1 Tax=Tenacibaculum aiptasiae TaxID=426481 RepID=UPI003B58C124
MKAVLTGDIINSRQGTIEDWIHLLKDILNNYGEEPKSWEIFRGDSFQLALDPKKALLAAIHIKSAIKQTKTYDVRIAIGIGEETYSSPKITEANGSAYIHSGECFEGLKKHSLGIKSGNTLLDQTLNTMFKLSLLITDNWSSVVSKVIKVALENPEKNQKDLAKLLDRSQSNISEALKRGGYDELLTMNEFYTQQIAQL